MATMKKHTVTTLVLRAPVRNDTDTTNAYVNIATGVMRAGTAPLTNGAFVIQVDGEAMHMDGDDALTRLVRNVLSAYPIVDIQGEGALPFDWQKWLRDHKKDL